MGAKYKKVICASCNEYRVHSGRGLCKACYYQTWKSENREHVNQYNRTNRKQLRRQNPEKYREDQRRRYRKMSWTKRALLQSSTMTVRKDISIDFLESLQHKTTHCPCCKVELNYAVNPRIKGGYRQDNQATLDKVVPVLSYIEDNVAIICFRCNRLKNAMTLDELHMLIAYIEEHLNGRELRTKTA